LDESAHPERRVGTRIEGGESNFSGPGPEVMAAATLQGDEVLNRKDERLGEVVDIMIDVESGRVAYAVLAYGGVLGIGEKLFAVPWHALSLDADRHCFILDVEQEWLRADPGFDNDHWPATGDPRFGGDMR
jgi:sporulation protein YlmC with PRC-barrel domain